MRRNGFRRVALVGLAVSGIVLTCLPVLAACGDGVVEGTEQCDDGSANGTDGCCSASCTLVDRDGDGLCDALDSCDLGNGLRIKETKLVARSIALIMRAAAARSFRVLRMRPSGMGWFRSSELPLTSGITDTPVSKPLSPRAS